MLAQCKTDDWVLASCWLIGELWQKGEPFYKRHNEILHGLLNHLRQKKEPNWCCAMLHLTLYPKLASIRAIFPEHTWSELHSALDQAIEDYDLERTSAVAACLS